MEDLGNIKLIPAHKVEWLEALRGGEYEQGRACLLDDGKFCCLGVICDVYKASHPGCMWKPIQPNFSSIERFYDDEGDDGEIFLTPAVVFKWLFAYEDEDGFDSAIQINLDEKDRKTFVDRYIKKNPPPYDQLGVETPTSSLTCMNDIGYSFAEIADVIEKYL